MNIKIREYKKKDEKSFKQSIIEMQILERKFKVGFLPPEKVVDARFAYLMEENKDYDGEIYVAEVDNKAEGFLSVFVNPVTEEEAVYAKSSLKDVFISHFYVFPHARGIGLGKRLLSKVDKFAKQRNIKYAGLVVCAENQNARKLFQLLGFKDLDVIMRKRIR
jgi:ribosomal protein S18 acetylase RimI-like enzyme